MLRSLLLLLTTGCGAWVDIPVDTADTEALERVWAVPDDLGFATPVGETDVQSFTVWNQTDRSIVLSYSDIDGEDADAFEVLSTEGMFLTLQPRDLAAISVTFTPQDDRYHYATLPITGEDVALEIDLLGLGQAPMFNASSDDAPDTTVGCESEATLTLSNSGDAVLDLDLLSSDLDDFELLEPLPEALEPNTAEGISLRFAPTTSGTHIGSFTFATNIPGDDTVFAFVRGQAVEAPTYTSSFHYDAGSGVDLLLLMDDGGSTSYASQVFTGVDDWLEAHLDKGVDYRVAGVSTEDGCPAVSGVWATSEDEVEDARDVVRDAVFDAGRGTYADALFTVARMAVDNTESGGCLEGFLRDDVPLHVLMASDRDESSSTGWEDQLTAMETIETDGVVVSVVIPLTGCAAAPSGYGDASDETGGLTLDSCSDDWNPYWDQLAALSAGLESGETSTTLVVDPDTSSIVVTVDGEVTTGWNLDDELTLTLSTAPEEGALVEVSYQPADACSEDT